MVDYSGLTDPKVTELVGLISSSLDGYSMRDVKYAMCVFQAFLIDYAQDSDATKKEMRELTDFVLARAKAANTKEFIREMAKAAGATKTDK